MTTRKIYSPWIKWHGGERPVPRDTLVKIKMRDGGVLGPGYAASFLWCHGHGTGDIVEYRTVTEQADLDAAEQLLRANGYTITPPAKPLTFEDITPMMEAPPEGTDYWAVQPFSKNGLARATWIDSSFHEAVLRHRMAYLDKEHALVAARHIFGLKGGEL